jgi:threonyl-tRNA synthetase
MLILGEKESEVGNVSVRRHQKGDLGTVSTENFVKIINKEISGSISKFGN